MSDHKPCLRLSLGQCHSLLRAGLFRRLMDWLLVVVLVLYCLRRWLPRNHDYQNR
jgi:hypothetical protein